MTVIKTLVLTTLLTLTCQLHAQEQTFTHAQLKQQATRFMHDYINTYNKRFGHPERADAFVDELSALVQKPFIMMPPSAAAPFYPESREAFKQVFDGFTQQLERKGAVRMAWQEINLEVLTPNKILANNIGVAFNASDEVVYETISLYMLYRGEEGWKIVLFSPYDFANRLAFEPG